MTATTKARALRLMAFDVDGVLTDGRLYFTQQGEAMKAFHTLDGQGIQLLRAAGVRPALITGRSSAIVEKRAEELGIELLFQGVTDKRACLLRLLEEQELAQEAAGFMGDDLIDLSAMRACAFAAAPANAHPFVRSHAAFVSLAQGGEGAVREVCDFILRAQDKFEAAVAPFLLPLGQADARPA
jgi:3-deoxy-D-manno-octulosonate 8-phosphate phosphatase (KDO 8-P phosphatase)